MFKRSSLYLALVTTLLLALVAIPTTAQDATPAPTPTVAAQTQGTGSTQLTILHGLTGGDGDAFANVISAFVKDNPDFSINNQALPWDQMYQRLQASFVAGDPPDVFIVHVSNIAQFASLGILRPSDDLLDTNGGPLPAKDFAGLDGTLWEGQHYGILWDNHGFGTWVNSGLFDKAGLDASNPPSSPDEFIQWAQQLTLDSNGKHPNEDGFDPNDVVQWGTAIDWVRVQFEIVAVSVRRQRSQRRWQDSDYQQRRRSFGTSVHGRHDSEVPHRPRPGESQRLQRFPGGHRRHDAVRHMVP